MIDTLIVTVCDAFNDSLKGIVRPHQLQALEFTFYSLFDKLIAGGAWPTSLKIINFGHYFNQYLEGVVLPAFLEELTFGRCF